MLRVIPLMLWIILAMDYCHAEKGEIYLPKDKSTGLRNGLNACAQSVNGDLDDLLQQIYEWNIKSEETVKDFLHCFFERRDANSPKFDPGNVLVILGDFDKKDEVSKALQDCNAKSTGSDAKERIFAFTGCFMRDTPVIIKI